MNDHGQQAITGHLDILEALPIMILDVDRDGILQFANKKVRERLGLPAELDEVSLSDVLDASSVGDAMSKLSELFSGEGDITSVWRLRTRTGLVQVETNAVTIYENGYPVRVRAYLHDPNEIVPVPAPVPVAPAPAPVPVTFTGSADAIAALKEEQEYTKALLEKSGLLVYIIDTRNNVVNTNSEMLKTTGFSHQNAPSLEHLLTGLYPDPKYRAIVQRIHENMYKNQHIRKTELTISTATGEVKHISWSTARLKNAKGQVHGFIAMGIDVSEKKKLEQWVKLQTSCFERVLDGVVVSDLGGIVINWIGGAERLLGYKQDQMVGKQLGELFPTEYRANIESSLKEGVDRDGRWSTELPMSASDGRKVYVRMDSAVILNEKGTPIALVTVLHDLTQQRQLARDLDEEKAEVLQLTRLLEDREKELRDSHVRTEDIERRTEYLERKNRDLEQDVSRSASGRSALEAAIKELSLFQIQILSTSSAALITLDAGGNVLTWSKGAEELTHFSDKDAFGKAHDQALKLEEFDWEMIQSEVTQTGRVVLPCTLVRRDESRQPILLEVAVLQDEQGQPLGYTEVALPPPAPAHVEDPKPDLSAELLRALDLSTLGQLSLGLARDMSDVFSSQHSNVRRLQDYVGDLKKLIELYRSGVSHRDIESFIRKVDLKKELGDIDFVFDETHEGLVRMRDLAQDLQRFLPGTGQLNEVLNLNELAESAASLLRLDLQNRARIERVYSEPCLASGNFGEITRAFVNIALSVLDRFTQASQVKNELKLQTLLDGDWAILQLSHNGPGLSDEIAGMLGDLMALVQTRDASAMHLAVASQLIASCGGVLERAFENGHEAFRIRLPALTVEPTFPGEDVERTDPTGNVMFIDDDKNQLRAYRRHFERYYNVFQVDNPDEALNVASVRHDFLAIVSDLLQPVEEGVRLIESLLARHPQLKGRCVVLVPPGTTREVRKKLASMVKVVLNKPVELESLASILSMITHPK